jgi:DinB family protein
MPSHRVFRSRFSQMALVAGLGAMLVPPSPAVAQAGGTELARLKTAYLADFAELEQKFTQLADAFPADKYGWQPMPGVRSVHQVLGLLAAENYLNLTPAFGGKPPADLPSGKGAEEKMEAIADKATIVKHIRGSFALAKQTITAWSGSPDGPISFWGEKRTLASLFMTVMADQHEHLGQLIAYARMNKIVPPWSH